MLLLILDDNLSKSLLSPKIICKQDVRNANRFYNITWQFKFNIAGLYSYLPLSSFCVKMPFCSTRPLKLKGSKTWFDREIHDTRVAQLGLQAIGLQYDIPTEGVHLL